MKASANVFPVVLFGEGAAPATPSAATVVAYAKADGLLYTKDDAGVETPLGGAAYTYTGTAGSITLTGSAFSIDAAYVGQTSITTLGTIAAGAWNGTTIGPVYGGTGQASYATGDLLYASATNVLSKLVAGTNGYVLTLVAGVPAWAAAASGAAWGGITGTLSSQTDLQAALDAKAPLSVTQNSKSAAYTLVLGDAGGHILHPSADTTARIFTIPANSSVAFPVGTVVTFVNQNAGGVITIAITTDTMRLAGTGSTGSRTLAANGIATAMKITSTEWIINGTGLT